MDTKNINQGETILKYPEYEEGKEKYETKRKPQSFVSKDDNKDITYKIYGNFWWRRQIIKEY